MNVATTYIAPIVYPLQCNFFGLTDTSQSQPIVINPIKMVFFFDFSSLWVTRIPTNGLKLSVLWLYVWHVSIWQIGYLTYPEMDLDLAYFTLYNIFWQLDIKIFGYSGHDIRSIRNIRLPFCTYFWGRIDIKLKILKKKSSILWLRHSIG